MCNSWCVCAYARTIAHLHGQTYNSAPASHMRRRRQARQDPWGQGGHKHGNLLYLHPCWIWFGIVECKLSAYLNNTTRVKFDCTPTSARHKSGIKRARVIQPVPNRNLSHAMKRVIVIHKFVVFKENSILWHTTAVPVLTYFFLFPVYELENEGVCR